MGKPPGASRDQNASFVPHRDWSGEPAKVWGLPLAPHWTHLRGAVGDGGPPTFSLAGRWLGGGDGWKEAGVSTVLTPGQVSGGVERGGHLSLHAPPSGCVSTSPAFPWYSAETLPSKQARYRQALCLLATADGRCDPRQEILTVGLLDLLGSSCSSISNAERGLFDSGTAFW
jgi:hypothetical protein